MSEGGKFPWKVMKNKGQRAAPDYQQLLKPLPEPPAGLKWVRVNHQNDKDNKDNKDYGSSPWKLVSTLVSQAVVESEESIHGHSSRSHPVVAVVDVEPLPTACLPASTTTTTTRTTLAVPEILDPILVPENEERSNDSTLPKACPVPLIAITSASPQQQHQQQETEPEAGELKQDSKLHPEGGRYQVDYTEHIILPDQDTLAGLCLRYRIDRRTLQRVNRFHGQDLRLAPRCLIIPITAKARRMGWQAQDTTSPSFQTATVRAQFPSLSMPEAKCYLETNDWDLEKALLEAAEDMAWEEAVERERLEREEQAARKITAAGSCKEKGKYMVSSMRNDPYKDDDNDDESKSCASDCFRFFFPSSSWAAPAPVTPLLELVHGTNDGSYLEL